MTDVMEMKRSNLVLPTSGYELDREEMSYVEGGIFVSQGTVDAILVTTVGYLSTNLSMVVYALNQAYNYFAGVLISILGGFGAFLALVGKIWFTAQFTELAKGFIESLPRKKGVDIGFGFSWVVIPGITCNARK